MERVIAAIDNVQFWKQFFEASANVSLSGYEENANEEDLTNNDTTSTQLETPRDGGEHAGTGAQQQGEDKDEFTVDSPTQVTGLQTTPKLSSTSNRPNDKPGSKAPLRSPSPRKYTGKNPLALEASLDEPSTPRPQTDSAHAQSSPFQPESAYQYSAQPSRANNDPLMHRVLDKNYRVQAAPHTQRRLRQQQAQAASKPTPATVTKLQPWDDSPQSSPAMAAPQLRSDLFSPAKPKIGGPRTPGISVLTPARSKPTAANGADAVVPTTSTGRQLFSPQDKAFNTTQERTRSRGSNIFSSPGLDSDEDDDDELDARSPPKTLQFHVPNSRLVQTPAREASKRIVEDLLLTAGAENTDDIEGIDDPSLVDEPSPSVVRQREWAEDDSF